MSRESFKREFEIYRIYMILFYIILLYKVQSCILVMTMIYHFIELNLVLSLSFYEVPYLL